MYNNEKALTHGVMSEIMKATGAVPRRRATWVYPVGWAMWIIIIGLSISATVMNGTPS